VRRERIEGAVEAGGRHAAADPFRGGVRVVITGTQGFERTVFVRFGRRSGGYHPTGQGDDRRMAVSSAVFVTP